jgi:hypothetical protein
MGQLEFGIAAACLLIQFQALGSHSLLVDFCELQE